METKQADTFQGKPCRACKGTLRYLSANHPCVACAQKHSLLRRQRLGNKKYVEDRNRVLLKKFGITLDEYNKIFEEQGGVCKICGRAPKTVSLNVDHCHAYEKATGKIKIRGLLCGMCNRRIVGVIERFKVDAQKVADYLRGDAVAIREPASWDGRKERRKPAVTFEEIRHGE